MLLLVAAFVEDAVSLDLFIDPGADRIQVMRQDQGVVGVGGEVGPDRAAPLLVDVETEDVAGLDDAQISPGHLPFQAVSGCTTMFAMPFGGVIVAPSGRRLTGARLLVFHQGVLVSAGIGRTVALVADHALARVLVLALAGFTAVLAVSVDGVVLAGSVQGVAVPDGFVLNERVIIPAVVVIRIVAGHSPALVFVQAPAVSASMAAVALLGLVLALA
jgi:hypothetical protein